LPYIEGMNVQGLNDQTDAVDSDAARAPGALRRALHRLASSEQALDAEQRQVLAVESGATPVHKCTNRSQVCVVGMLRTVTIQPRGMSPSLQAELWDGSGIVDVIWIGRRRIPGIEPGRVIRANGRISEREGRRVIFNPRYELFPTGS
jgi:hypothetical protein